jgi:hypothetical protein
LLSDFGDQKSLRAKRKPIHPILRIRIRRCSRTKPGVNSVVGVSYNDASADTAAVAFGVLGGVIASLMYAVTNRVSTGNSAGRLKKWLRVGTGVGRG